MTMAPTQERKALLDLIIENQEGGWKLSHLEGDNDGGWTYAGVTAKTYSEWVHGYIMGEPSDEVISRELFEERLQIDSAPVKLAIYEIYSKKYCAPLQLDDIPWYLQGALLSCAINCGVETAIKILQKVVNAPQDGEFGLKTKACMAVATNNGMDIDSQFLDAWIHHYIDLVVADPEKLKFLKGWFNRVTYWREYNILADA